MRFIGLKNKLFKFDIEIGLKYAYKFSMMGYLYDKITIWLVLHDSIPDSDKQFFSSVPKCTYRLWGLPSSLMNENGSFPGRSLSWLTSSSAEFKNVWSNFSVSLICTHNVVKDNFTFEQGMLMIRQHR